MTSEYTTSSYNEYSTDKFLVSVGSLTNTLDSHCQTSFIPNISDMSPGSFGILFVDDSYSTPSQLLAQISLDPEPNPIPPSKLTISEESSPAIDPLIPTEFSFTTHPPPSSDAPPSLPYISSKHILLLNEQINRQFLIANRLSFRARSLRHVPFSSLRASNIKRQSVAFLPHDTVETVGHDGELDTDNPAPYLSSDDIDRRVNESLEMCGVTAMIRNSESGDSDSLSSKEEPAKVVLPRVDDKSMITEMKHFLRHAVREWCDVADLNGHPFDLSDFHAILAIFAQDTLYFVWTPQFTFFQTHPHTIIGHDDTNSSDSDSDAKTNVSDGDGWGERRDDSTKPDENEGSDKTKDDIPLTSRIVDFAKLKNCTFTFLRSDTSGRETQAETKDQVEREIERLGLGNETAAGHSGSEDRVRKLLEEVTNTTQDFFSDCSDTILKKIGQGSYGKVKEKIHIVMEYCDSGDLGNKIKECRRKGFYLPENLILDFFTHITFALHDLHKDNVMHRDVKAENIYIWRGTIAKLGDFGVSRTLRNHFEMASTITGTPYYMSPELLVGQPYNTLSDIWSLGILLYEITALHLPFSASSLPQLRERIEEGEIEALPEQYSEELSELVVNVLTVAYQERPNCSEILSMPIITNRMKSFLHHYEKEELTEEEKQLISEESFQKVLTVYRQHLSSLSPMAHSTRSTRSHESTRFHPVATLPALTLSDALGALTSPTTQNPHDLLLHIHSLFLKPQSGSSQAPLPAKSPSPPHHSPSNSTAPNPLSSDPLPKTQQPTSDSQPQLAPAKQPAEPQPTSEPAIASQTSQPAPSVTSTINTQISRPQPVNTFQFETQFLDSLNDIMEKNLDKLQTLFDTLSDLLVTHSTPASSSSSFVPSSISYLSLFTSLPLSYMSSLAQALSVLYDCSLLISSVSILYTVAGHSSLSLLIPLHPILKTLLTVIQTIASFLLNPKTKALTDWFRWLVEGDTRLFSSTSQLPLTHTPNSQQTLPTTFPQGQQSTTPNTSSPLAITPEDILFISLNALLNTLKDNQESLSASVLTQTLSILLSLLSLPSLQIGEWKAKDTAASVPLETETSDQKTLIFRPTSDPLSVYFHSTCPTSNLLLLLTLIFDIVMRGMKEKKKIRQEGDTTNDFSLLFDFSPYSFLIWTVLKENRSQLVNEVCASIIVVESEGRELKKRTNPDLEKSPEKVPPRDDQSEELRVISVIAEMLISGDPETTSNACFCLLSLSETPSNHHLLGHKSTSLLPLLVQLLRCDVFELASTSAYVLMDVTKAAMLQAEDDEEAERQRKDKPGDRRGGKNDVFVFSSAEYIKETRKQKKEGRWNDKKKKVAAPGRIVDDCRKQLVSDYIIEVILEILTPMASYCSGHKVLPEPAKVEQATSPTEKPRDGRSQSFRRTKTASQSNLQSLASLLSLSSSFRQLGLVEPPSAIRPGSHLSMPLTRLIQDQKELERKLEEEAQRAQLDEEKKKIMELFPDRPSLREDLVEPILWTLLYLVSGDTSSHLIGSVNESGLVDVLMILANGKTDSSKIQEEDSERQGIMISPTLLSSIMSLSLMVLTSLCEGTVSQCRWLMDHGILRFFLDVVLSEESEKSQNEPVMEQLPPLPNDPLSDRTRKRKEKRENERRMRRKAIAARGLENLAFIGTQTRLKQKFKHNLLSSSGSLLPTLSLTATPLTPQNLFVTEYEKQDALRPLLSLFASLALPSTSSQSTSSLNPDHQAQHSAYSSTTLHLLQPIASMFCYLLKGIHFPPQLFDIIQFLIFNIFSSSSSLPSVSSPSSFASLHPSASLPSAAFDFPDRIFQSLSFVSVSPMTASLFSNSPLDMTIFKTSQDVSSLFRSVTASTIQPQIRIIQTPSPSNELLSPRSKVQSQEQPTQSSVQNPFIFQSSTNVTILPPPLVHQPPPQRTSSISFNPQKFTFDFPHPITPLLIPLGHQVISRSLTPLTPIVGPSISDGVWHLQVKFWGSGYHPEHKQEEQLDHTVYGPEPSSTHTSPSRPSSLKMAQTVQPTPTSPSARTSMILAPPSPFNPRPCHNDLFKQRSRHSPLSLSLPPSGLAVGIVKQCVDYPESVFLRHLGTEKGTCGFVSGKGFVQSSGTTELDLTFEDGDVIGMEVNMITRSLLFFVNGVQWPVTITKLPEAIYFAISFNRPGCVCEVVSMQFIPPASATMPLAQCQIIPLKS
ncbi:putative G2-specific protein kinase nim-1 [Blattamonas nauphoetae]|uniref:non-specific serine/threonine protein kinase n=1 Tax=Blattamonas nauphoetae TaxID=2049346 RepID=A0ABQ9XAL7_9EUKA|nr:putative G2-specific protein kinase nim-1 [Blattamonas nauphoetae]